ncbi:hypothetical protein EYF80_004696 [Liparis tanakae]|uniref:Uncharacterized protein n=1 Tax=Liparis tanakae TaxID=230148 RepID=A0A4Z2J6C3_9TELE|nr:hypothetical protein EYF80_004696 [Liparis tanakae]
MDKRGVEISAVPAVPHLKATSTDHPLDEVVAKLHPLKARLGGGDGVEDGCIYLIHILLGVKRGKLADDTLRGERRCGRVTRADCASPVQTPACSQCGYAAAVSRRCARAAGAKLWASWRDVFSEGHIENHQGLSWHGGVGEGVTAAVRPDSALQVRPVPYRMHRLVPGQRADGEAFRISQGDCQVILSSRSRPTENHSDNKLFSVPFSSINCSHNKKRLLCTPKTKKCMNSKLFDSGGGGYLSLVSYVGNGATTRASISSMPVTPPRIGVEYQRQLLTSEAFSATLRTARLRQHHTLLRKAQLVTEYGVTPPRTRPPLNSRNLFNQSEYSCSRRVLRSTPEVNAGKSRASFRCVLQGN